MRPIFVEETDVLEIQKMHSKKESSADGVERRVDGPVDEVDEGVVIATVEGVGPAIDHMANAGVERETALRVLSSPEHHRKVKPGTLLAVLKMLSSRLWARK